MRKYLLKDKLGQLISSSTNLSFTIKWNLNLKRTYIINWKKEKKSVAQWGAAEPFPSAQICHFNYSDRIALYYQIFTQIQPVLNQ